MIKRAGALLIFTLLLTACGQRGALYLPDEERNVVVTPATPAAQDGATAAPATDTTDPQKRSTRGQ